MLLEKADPHAPDWSLCFRGGKPVTFEQLLAGQHDFIVVDVKARASENGGFFVFVRQLHGDTNGSEGDLLGRKHEADRRALVAEPLRHTHTLHADERGYGGVAFA
jgi:hypothetical protein